LKLAIKEVQIFDFEREFLWRFGYGRRVTQ